MAPIVSMDTASAPQNGHTSWAKADSLNGANGAATDGANHLHIKPEHAAQVSLFDTFSSSLDVTVQNIWELTHILHL